MEGLGLPTLRAQAEVVPVVGLSSRDPRSVGVCAVHLGSNWGAGVPGCAAPGFWRL